MGFGIAAWVVSYRLAAMSLGLGAPKWLAPAAVGAFGVVYAVIGAGSLVLEYRADRQRNLNEVERDGNALVDELSALGQTPLNVTPDTVSLGLAELERTYCIVRRYMSKISPRAKRLAKELRGYRHVPKDDAFFQLVTDSPQNANEVAEIAAGLERLLWHLRESK